LKARKYMSKTEEKFLAIPSRVVPVCITWRSMRAVFLKKNYEKEIIQMLAYKDIDCGKHAW